MNPPFRLCLILTQNLCVRDPLDVLRAAMQGGIDGSCKVRKDLKLAYQTKQEGNKTLAEEDITKEELDKANKKIEELDDLPPEKG